MRRAIIFNLLLQVYLTVSINLRIDPLVKIDQGLLKGLKGEDGSYSKFLGIPYAQVDLNNPFGSALPAEEFDGIYEAYDDSIKCPQNSDSGNESLDCLRLNIYVPDVATSLYPLPVLVYIHGGGYSSRSAADLVPTNLVKKDIIVVTINYRLGPYGFLCLDIPSVPGNQGLKDQQKALMWIKENIAAFGGNANQITLGGESAGSGSVFYHLYSPATKVFNKIIAQSDTPMSEGMFVNKDVDAAIKLANHLGLSTTDTEQALQFLITTEPNLVVGASKDLDLQLKPCKENIFSDVDNIITNGPFSLSNDNKVKNTPILIGHTTQEHKVNVLLDLYGVDYFSRDPFYEKIAKNFNMDEEKLSEAAKVLRKFYIGDEPMSEELTNILEDFDSDYVMNYPVHRTITKLLKENAQPIYQYLYSYSEDPDATGVSHAAENDYLFDSNKDKDEEGQLITELITTLWANYVKYGNPTPEETELLPVTWTPVSEELRPYLVIDRDLRMKSQVYNDRMAFWDLFYSLYGSNHVFIDGNERSCSLKH